MSLTLLNKTGAFKGKKRVKMAAEYFIIYTQ